MNRLLDKVAKIEDVELRDEIVILIRHANRLSTDLKLILSEVHAQYEPDELNGVKETVLEFNALQQSHTCKESVNLPELEFKLD